VADEFDADWVAPPMPPTPVAVTMALPPPLLVALPLPVPVPVPPGAVPAHAAAMNASVIPKVALPKRVIISSLRFCRGDGRCLLCGRMEVLSATAASRT
jgi:hypothetical protein